MWWSNFKKARKPIVITTPGTITKASFDKVTNLIKEHRHILAEVKEVNGLIEKGVDRYRGKGYGYGQDALATYIVRRKLEETVIKALTESSIARSEVVIKEIEAIIPDYRLNQATELTEIQEALEDLLAALNAPGIIGE